MRSRAPLVQRAGTRENEKRGEVRDSASDGNHQHYFAIDLRWGNEALRGFEHDGYRDREQQQPIGISGQRLISAMAIRALVTRRAPAGADCDHGKDERATIRQHMGRLGQQGDGAGPESTNGLYEREGRKNAQGDPQAALARDLAYVMMSMITVMSMIMA
jgi:hypothetical protein